MPPADLIVNLQFFDFAVEHREAEPKDIGGADLVTPGLSQSAFDVAFLIKFDRVGKVVVRAERGVGCWLRAGQIPRLSSGGCDFEDISR